MQVTLPSYLQSCPEDPVGALQQVRKTKEGPEGLAMKEAVSLLREKADTRDQLSVTLKSMWEILPRFKMRGTDGRNQIKNWLELKARITTVTPLHIDHSPSRRLRPEQCPTAGRWVVCKPRVAICHEPLRSLSYPIPKPSPRCRKVLGAWRT